MGTLKNLGAAGWKEAARPVMPAPVVKAGAAGLLGAAAATQSEDAEAMGLLNTPLRALRSASDVDTRDLAQERSSLRGTRNVAKQARLSDAEKRAIESSVAGKNVEVRDAYAVAREWKKRHPASDWHVPEITGVDVDKKGNVKVRTRAIQYGFNIDPRTGRQARPGSRHYNKIVSGVVDEITDIARRAEAGDPAAQRVMNNAGWYKNMEGRLRTEYGSFAQMMSDILGATSPNTPVATNFRFSQDILTRATRGDFDELMNGFADRLDHRYALLDQAAAYLRDQMESGRTKTSAQQDDVYIDLQDRARQISRQLQAEENTIKQTSIDPKTGKLKNYGINSYNSMIALADRWRVLRPGGAPKARNFSGNLSGRSEKATIDVWAARNLRRHSGRKPIPSSAEQAVTGNIVDAEEFTNSLEFGFGQDVLADATVRLNNELGMNLDPRDLQALQWFAEKDHWASRGWTSAAGEGGSFETMADNDPVGSMFLGLSREQNQEFQGNDFVPTPAQSAATARQIISPGLLDDPDVRAAKGMPSIGRYGDPETAMDIDVVSRQDQMPTSILDAAARQAVEDKQDSWFIATRIDDVLGYQHLDKMNVGSEVYFRDAVAPDSALLTDLQKELSDLGVPGYTMIIDPRDANRVTGVRFLDIPQFYDAEGFARMPPQQYAAHVQKTLGDYDVIGQRLKSKFPQVQSAAPGYFDVNVKSRGQTQSYVDELENPQRDPDALRQEFYGWKPATQRFQEFAGKTQPYYLSDGDGPPRAPSSPQRERGFATPGALAATAGASTAAAAAPSALDYGLGILDAGANFGQALISPMATAPHTLIQALTSDRPTAEIEAESQRMQQRMDYQPRTEIGQQISDEATRRLGSLLQPVVKAVGDEADKSLIMRGAKSFWNQLHPRTRLVSKSLLDMVP